MTVHLVCEVENGSITVVMKYYSLEEAKIFMTYGQFIMTVEEK